MAEGVFPTVDRLDLLREATSARVGLGRVGSSMPTAPVLAFQLAQAQARDAVQDSLRVADLEAALQPGVLKVRSAAPDRQAYLQNPDLGRRLGQDDHGLQKGRYDLAIVLADGLSAGAVNSQGPTLVDHLMRRLAGWLVAPVVLAEQARVAIGDPIGEQLGASLILVLIGERPGLSSPQSLGAYITFDPRPGRLDSERNCVSNIHSSGGLSLDQAADKIVWLLAAARRMGFTGTALKDRQAPDVQPIASASSAMGLPSQPERVDDRLELPFSS